MYLDGKSLEATFSRNEICVIKSLIYLKNKKKGTDLNNIFKICEQDKEELNKSLIEGIINKLIKEGVIGSKYHSGKTSHQVLLSFNNSGDILNKRQENEIEEELIIPLNELQVPNLLFEEFISEKLVISGNEQEFVTKVEFECLRDKVDRLIGGKHVCEGGMDCGDKIDFLKSELKSKDLIIEILQRTVNSLECESSKNNNLKRYNKNSQEDFIIPKRVAKERNKTNERVNLPTSNRFNCLKEHDNNDCTNTHQRHQISKDNQYIFSLEHSQDNNTDVIDAESITEKKRQHQNKKKRTVTILGDSIVKGIEGYKMREALNNTTNVYVKSFSGANIDDMKSYIKPSTRRNPHAIIIHCGTNELRNDNTAEEIADNIVNLALSVKTETTEVIISGITPRKDKLNAKGMKVNEYLYKKLSERNMGFINNDNIDANIHLNKSGLHLNYIGTKRLADNFLDIINI